MLYDVIHCVALACFLMGFTARAVYRISPFRVLAQSTKMRIGVCSEELCFANPAVGTFIGLGNGFPIQRGGSIHQKVV